MQAQTLHTLLLLSEDHALQESVTAALGTESDYRLIRCASQREAAARLDSVQIHLLIADADMIEDVEKNVFVDTRISHPQVARLLVGSAADLCVDLCRRAAAYLYLLKPTSDHQLRLVASRALELNELSRRHRLLSREFKISMDDGIFAGGTDPLSVKGGLSQFEKMVFVSAKMADLCAEARQAAKTELPVLIHGETGTGKELLARAIHFNSPRINSPLHVQNCGGICDDTLHSELFGHVRGAFTGAISDRLGLFRAADGGTVFLDEISEISPRFQVSLLRFLQEREIKPLGSDKIQYADVRIIAASNRPLHKLVEQGDVPARPLLSAEGVRTVHSLPARAAGGYSGADAILHREIRRRRRDAASSASRWTRSPNFRRMTFRAMCANSKRKSAEWWRSPNRAATSRRAIFRASSTR